MAGESVKIPWGKSNPRITTGKVTIILGKAANSLVKVPIPMGRVTAILVLVALAACGFAAGRGDPGFGTVEAGKTADLVLLDADPLADIYNTRRIAGVVVNGRWLGPRDLQEMLDRVAAEAG